MGKDPNELFGYGRKPKPQEGQLGTRPIGITTFHPTKGEADDLKLGAMPLPDALDQLTELLERNVSVSLGYRVENGAFYAVARDRAGAWNEAPAVSAFHSSIEGSLRALAYAMKHRWPDFPDKFQPSVFYHDEW